MVFATCLASLGAKTMLFANSRSICLKEMQTFKFKPTEIGDAAQL